MRAGVPLHGLGNGLSYSNFTVPDISDCQRALRLWPPYFKNYKKGFPSSYTEQPMVRDRQKLLGRFVIETTQGHEQEVRVIGECSRIMFDSVLETRAAESFWASQALLLPS